MRISESLRGPGPPVRAIRGPRREGAGGLVVERRRQGVRPAELAPEPLELGGHLVRLDSLGYDVEPERVGELDMTALGSV